MRALLTAAILLVSLSSAAIAGPREDALQVLEKWARAFNESDVDAIVKLHAPDAMFMGTASKTVVVNTEGIRAYFENALPNDRPRTAKLKDYTAVVLSDTAVAVSGLDTLTGVRDGKTYILNGRVTFVVGDVGPIGKSRNSIVLPSQTNGDEMRLT
jgi:ketosteroid isomerase-like protein